MPVPVRPAQRFGLLAKEEAVYGVAETLSNTLDACEVYIGDGEPPEPDGMDFIYDGNGPGRIADTGAPRLATAPAGASRQVPFKTMVKGRGAAYSASLTPPNAIHRWLKASGYDATYNGGAGTWTYTPTALNYTATSLTVRRFAQERQFDDIGVIASFNYSTSSQNPLGLLIADFSDAKGIASLPADLTIPTLTHGQFGTAPLVVSGMTIIVNGLAALPIRSLSYKQNRKISGPRPQTNIAGGNAGYIHDGSMPMVEIEMERVALATFDPETMRNAGTVFALQWAFNVSVAANRFRHYMAQAQIMDVKNGQVDGMATCTITVRPHASTSNVYDYEYLVFD